MHLQGQVYEICTDENMFVNFKTNDTRIKWCLPMEDRWQNDLLRLQEVGGGGNGSEY